MSTIAIPTYVHARDPISHAGVSAQLRMRPDVLVVDSVSLARVAIVVADVVDQTTTGDLRALVKDHRPRLVLIVGAVDDAALVA
ncbi:MAG: DNA-binding response regulator, partial [Propionibacterium sp.]|nr:DNA-binding response regulator [Propionibacterium sp.]